VFPARQHLAGLLGLLLAACHHPADTSAPPPSRETPALPSDAPAPPARLTPAQQAIQHRLSEQLQADRPTHRLVLHSGQTVEGQLLAESARAIRFREPHGYSGHITASYDRNAIRRIESIPAADFQITDDDARLAAEFPAFHFRKVPPYSLVTDESYSEVERTLRILTELRRQFEDHFAALHSPPTQPLAAQVVLFAREDAFREYARRTAPGLAGSAGFFRHADHRLVLLNQLGSRQYTEFQSRLTDRWQRVAAEPRAQQHLAAWRSHVTLEARSLNERLIRHEGAHQLFHACGIHSAAGIEPTWLTEGLAQYCEPTEIGRRHPALAARLLALQHAATLIPLRELLNHRTADGFFDFGQDRVESAYAQSWALVYWLMQPPRRERFHSLLQHYRQSADFDPDPAETLARHLGASVAEIERDWRAFLPRL